MSNSTLFLPEIVCAMTALVLFFCPVLKLRYCTTWLVALAGSAAVTAAAVVALPLEGEPFAPGIYKVDAFSQAIKLILSIGLLLVVVISREPKTVRRAAWGEFPMFLALSTLGMMMLVSSMELITIYVALELSAYPIYVLVALNRNKHEGIEGAAKYMLLGMVASAVSIYGLSFLFGASGTTYLAHMAADMGNLAAQPIFWLGLLFAFAGFLFKLAIFPFHFWAPDTYQSAPHEVVTFIATASKVAAVAMITRFAALVLPAGFDSNVLHTVLLWMSVAAMTLGNLAAIVQKDLKRLFGYSAVAHAGYVMIGVQALSELGMTSALFYVIGYFLMGFLCFLAVCEVGRDRDLVGMDAISGLYKRSPLLALALMVGIFGLTGLPPTVGFIGKWFLFSAALERGQFILVLVAAINSAIALYYYMRVIRQAFFVPPETDSTLTLKPLTGLAAFASLVVVVWMGTAPDFFWRLASSAAKALVGM